MSESRSSLVVTVRDAMFFGRIFAICVLLLSLGNRMVEWARVGLLIAFASLMSCADGSVYSDAVDIFNVTSGAWSTAALSAARADLAATSLANVGVAIFAGGYSTCCHVFWPYLCDLCLVAFVGESDG
jgi:hypothetical protein